MLEVKAFIGSLSLFPSRNCRESFRNLSTSIKNGEGGLSQTLKKVVIIKVNRR